jgi:hypothetical protein
MSSRGNKKRNALTFYFSLSPSAARKKVKNVMHIIIIGGGLIIGRHVSSQANTDGTLAYNDCFAFILD